MTVETKETKAPDSGSSILAKLTGAFQERLADDTFRLFTWLTNLHNGIKDGDDLRAIKANAVTCCQYARDFEDAALRAFIFNGAEKREAAAKVHETMIEISRDLHDGKLAPTDALPKINALINDIWKVVLGK